MCQGPCRSRGGASGLTAALLSADYGERMAGRVLTSVRRFHLRVVAAVTAVTAIAMGSSAAAVHTVESDAPGANIRTYADALWWAMETITTVGYGDLHPVTPAGRVVAGMLMVVGLALVGVITATVVTWFFTELDLMREVRRIEESEEKTEASLEIALQRIEAITERLDRWEQQRRNDP